MSGGLRLHEGLSGRKILPRRQAVHHRRRHQRNSEAGDRAAAAEEQLTMVEAILAGDARARARAAMWIENREPEAEALLEQLFPHTGHALILGITGPPGAGKSTLCDALAL